MRGGPRAQRTLALDQSNITRARAFRGVFRCEIDALTLAEQLEHGAAHRAAVEEVLEPHSSRMNPNPLSINRRAIVPLGIPVPSEAIPPGVPEGRGRREISTSAHRDTPWYPR